MLSGDKIPITCGTGAPFQRIFSFVSEELAHAGVVVDACDTNVLKMTRLSLYCTTGLAGALNELATLSILARVSQHVERHAKRMCVFMAFDTLEFSVLVTWTTYICNCGWVLFHGFRLDYRIVVSFLTHPFSSSVIRLQCFFSFRRSWRDDE